MKHGKTIDVEYAGSKVEHVEVLLCVSYGGFSFSTAFDDAKQKYLNEHPDVSDDDEDDDEDEERSGVNVLVAKQIGLSLASGPCCELGIASVPAFMAPYFEPGEYDGIEWVEFDIPRFWDDLIARERNPINIVLEMARFMFFYNLK